MSEIDHLVWRSVIPDLPFNPDTAIYKFWRSCRDEEQFFGAPITTEIDLGNGRIQQGFASGAVIEWSAENGAKLV